MEGTGNVVVLSAARFVSLMTSAHIYDPGNCPVALSEANGSGGKQMHITREVRDEKPITSPRDYCRVAIDVENRIVELRSTQY